MRAGAHGQKDEGAGNDDSVMFCQCVLSRRWAAHGLLMPEFNSLNPIDYKRLVLRGKISWKFDTISKSRNEHVGALQSNNIKHCADWPAHLC